MRSILLVLADDAVTGPDGKMDLFGAGWDEIDTDELPLRMPSLAVAARVALLPHEVVLDHEWEARIEAPSGAVLARVGGPVHGLAAEARRWLGDSEYAVGAVFKFSDLVFDEAGVHPVTVRLDGRAIAASIELLIEVRSPPEA